MPCTWHKEYIPQICINNNNNVDKILAILEQNPSRCKFALKYFPSDFSVYSHTSLALPLYCIRAYTP